MNKKLYNFFDRREEEYLNTHDLDEAMTVIFKHEQKDMDPSRGSLSDKEKIKRIINAGFLVDELPEIETLIHTSMNIDHNATKVQVTFNDGILSVDLDLHIEETNGQKYIIIDFLNQEKAGEDRYWRRMYDIYGNEKTIEWCSACEEEVVLDNKLKEQKCPSCGEKIIPCNICEHGTDDYNCGSCPVICKH